MSAKLTFLGVGSAFTKKNHQTNLLIENESESMLIDCGETAHKSLYELKKDPSIIKDVFVTHLHGDHIHGLEEMAYMHYFVHRPMGKKETGIEIKPTIISAINILNTLWDSGLKAGLNSIQYQLNLLSDYFDVECLVHNDKKHAHFLRCGLRFELVRTDHIYIEKKFDIPSYGALIETPTGRKVLYTGDTKFDWENFQWLFKHCDSILHDCQLFDVPNGVHASYNDLKSLPDDIKAKMWLMHYGDNYGDFNAVSDGFKGFVEQHKEYDIEEI